MTKAIQSRQRKTSEDGYLLIAAIFLLFLLTLSLTIAAPLIAKSIQRDREVETMERGKQYTRAIQLYYRKFHAYPPSIDALVKTTNIRFLRKKYVDPMTGKDDWKPIQFGQNKAPMAMGFFGEPLAGGATALAGTGPTGGNSTPGAGFGTPTTGPSTGMSGLFGSTPTSGAGTAAGSTTDPSTNPTTGTSGQVGGAPTGGPTTGTSTLSGQVNQTFGGAGIVGVEPANTRQSILLYKKKDHYNDWEFTYSPLTDQMKQGGAIAPQQPTNLPGQIPSSNPPPVNRGTVQQNQNQPQQ